ncbi:hypothetical protein J6S35_00005 [Candidatus Saccharibacteria bacterium]|nr:hypothetical protein [Candidatus Saccharibacteria bacterium]
MLIKNPLTIVNQGGPTPVPSEDLELPTPAEKECYLLLDIQPDAIDDVYFTPGQLSGNGIVCAFGTSSGGQFVQDATIPELNSTAGWTTYIPASKFVTTAGGRKQLIAKIYTTDSFTGFGSGTWQSIGLIRKYRANLPGANHLSFYSSNAYAQGYALIEAELKNGRLASNTFNGRVNLYKAKLTDVALPNNNGAENLFANCASLEEVELSGLTFDTGKRFSTMFSGCKLLKKLPMAWLNSASGNITVFTSMFSSCWSIFYYDLREMDFSSATNMNGMFSSAIFKPTTIRFGDKFPAGGIPATNAIVSPPNSATYRPCYVTIEKTDAMLPITTNASTLFPDSYTTVYVPDALLATYQADTYWSTLGDRLKALSAYPGTLPA